MFRNFLFFFLFLIAAFGVWAYLLKVDAPVYQPELYAARIEKIRTFGLNERPSEIRKAIATPEWMKDELDLILSDLKSGIDSTSQDQLTESQVLEIVSTLSDFGPRMASATSAVLKLLEAQLLSNGSYQKNKYLFQELLLALARFNSIPDSIPEDILNRCEKDSKEDTENSVLYCALSKRIGHAISENAEKKLQVETDKVISSLPNFEGKLLCLYSPFFKKDDFYKVTQLLMDTASTNELRRLIINCSIDMLSNEKKALSEEKKELINKLSDIMQYDKNKILRREALLVLLQSRVEEAVSLVKGYGHKFINGEVKADDIDPHPFRQWALETAPSN